MDSETLFTYIILKLKHSGYPNYAFFLEKVSANRHLALMSEKNNPHSLLYKEVLEILSNFQDDIPLLCSNLEKIILSHNHQKPDFNLDER